MSLLAPGIYLESTTAGGGFRHLYMVLKDGSADPHNWKVIRGDFGLKLGVTAFLTTDHRSIEDSLDKYDLNGSLLGPESVSDARRAADITGKLGGIGAWNDLVSYALRLNEVYPYELPFGGEDHVANSNALILTLLNRYGVDIRTIGTLDFGDFPGAKGVDDKAATLLGAGTDPAITASPNLETGLSILGRDDVDDIITGTGFDDRLFGKEGDDILDGGAGNDVFKGGPGADIFIVGEGAGSVDVFLGGSDEDRRDDRIVFRASLIDVAAAGRQGEHRNVQNGGINIYAKITAKQSPINAQILPR